MEDEVTETKRAFITGVTGQDGSYMAQQLLEKGYEVHGLVRRSSTFNRSRIDHLHHDDHLPGKNLHLRHLSPDCRALLEKAGDLVEVSVIEDPRYGIAVDYGARFDDEIPK